MMVWAKREIVGSLILIVVCSALAAFIGYELGKRDSAAEVGRVATNELAMHSIVKKAINSGNLEEANKSLDAQMFQDLFYISTYRELNLGDAGYTRHLYRTVKMLKDTWMAFPPYYIDIAGASFIDQICEQAGNCPPGQLRVP